jgi:poly(A)-specific ribonuclease
VYTQRSDSHRPVPRLREAGRETYSATWPARRALPRGNPRERRPPGRRRWPLPAAWQGRPLSCACAGLRGGMDVSCTNFRGALRVFKEHLPTASFVAFDLEFTGLGMELSSHLDTPQRRYEMSRKTATAFPPCQFGIVIFRPAPVLGEAFPEGDRAARWEAVPFNFNLCQKPVYENSSKQFPMRDTVFSIQASCAAFLYHNHFDFNKMFGRGVSWLRKDDEKSIRDQILAESPAARPSGSRMQRSELNDRDGAFVDDLAEALVEQFGEPKQAEAAGDVAGRAAADGPAGGAGDARADQRAMSAGEEGKILLWDRHGSARVRKYIFDMLHDNYPRLTVRHVSAEHQCGGFMLRLQEAGSEEDARAANEACRVKESSEAIDRRLNDDVGFRHVIDALLEARVPVVGHNALHDICKTYANFVRALPRRLADFKTAVHADFPCVIDTKHLLEACVMRTPWISDIMRAKKYDNQSALADLNEQIDKTCVDNGLERVHVRYFTNPDNVNDDLNDVFRAYDDLNAGGFKHQAGYDAFVTGKVFLQLATVLRAEPVPFDPRTRPGREAMDDLVSHPSLRPLLNRISVASCGGYSSLDLAAGDPAADEVNVFIDRDDVVVLRGFRQYAKVVGRTGNLGHGEIFRLSEQVLEGTPFHATRPNRRILREEDAVMLILEPRPLPPRAPQPSRPTTDAAAPEPGVGDATEKPRTQVVDAALFDGRGERKGGKAAPASAGNDRKRPSDIANVPFASSTVTAMSPKDHEAGLSSVRANAGEMGLSVMTYAAALALPARKRRRRDTREGGNNAEQQLLEAQLWQGTRAPPSCVASDDDESQGER